jgi:hypothetical protein
MNPHEIDGTFKHQLALLGPAIYRSGLGLGADDAKIATVLLLGLYDYQKRKYGPGVFADISKIARDRNLRNRYGRIDELKIQRIADFLHEADYLKAAEWRLYRITPQGVQFVEQALGVLKNGWIRTFMMHPWTKGISLVLLSAILSLVDWYFFQRQ